MNPPYPVEVARLSRPRVSNMKKHWPLTESTRKQVNAEQFLPLTRPTVRITPYLVIVLPSSTVVRAHLVEKILEQSGHHQNPLNIVGR